MESLTSLIASKLEGADFKGAVRLACSEASVADKNDRTLAALRQKHPPPHPQSQILPPPAESNLSPFISEAAVAQSIRSFPNGSAVGPDGLKRQHPKDMTGALVEGVGPVLLKAFTSLVNVIHQGKTPKAVRSLFFGANLTVLTKKHGGVRPIAVGRTLCRFAAKVAGTHITDAMGALLAPRQLRYGTPQGAEAAVHSLRQDAPCARVGTFCLFSLQQTFIPFLSGKHPSCRQREYSRGILWDPYFFVSPSTNMFLSLAVSCASST